jgi:hydroxyacylglutathione hydrolase
MARKVFEDLYYSRSKYYDPSIYILVDEESRVLLIDAGSGDFHEHPEHELWDVGLRKRDVSIILVTHKHYNHYAGARKFPWAQVYAHATDAVAMESGDPSTMYHLFHANPTKIKVHKKLAGPEKLEFGRFELLLIPCPGHTRGSICIYEENLGLLFTGDTVFCNGSIGRTDLNEDPGSYLATLEKIMELNPRKIFPGHGDPCDGDRFKELVREKIQLYRELGILGDHG